jgi:prolyl-tRNA editing enzyme YbaK/EbsC (Cys-tRNA(Pro) deacylase)
VRFSSSSGPQVGRLVSRDEFRGGMPVKTVVFMAGDDLVVVLLPLPARVSVPALRALLPVGMARPRTLSETDVLEAVGVPAGCVGPLIVPATAAIVVETSVASAQRCYCGSGSPGVWLEVAGPELCAALRLTNTVLVGDITAGQDPRTARS